MKLKAHDQLDYLIGCVPEASVCRRLRSGESSCEGLLLFVGLSESIYALDRGPLCYALVHQGPMDPNFKRWSFPGLITLQLAPPSKLLFHLIISTCSIIDVLSALSVFYHVLLEISKYIMAQHQSSLSRPSLSQCTTYGTSRGPVATANLVGSHALSPPTDILDQSS